MGRPQLLRGRLKRLSSGVSTVLCGVLGAAIFLLTPARADDSLEIAVKATYLYKFAPFVTWPSEAFDSPTSPLVICVVGRDPFGPVLDRAVAGQAVAGRRVAVRRLGMVRGRDGCHIVYVGTGGQSAAQALQAVRGQPVLTVTDNSSARGVFDFVIVDNRVRFRIDERPAVAGGLQISSKLLSLAVGVSR